jgi:GntR family transcriptional regulator, transcriptional repressor for pyruvate dehydrogenase complex
LTILKKISTVEAVVNLLTSRIHAGIYPPGSKLPSERILQMELGVGRLALREALSRLNAMGIIATVHGRGTFVQDGVTSKALKNVLIPHFALDDPKRLAEFVEARAMLESELAGLAAQRRTTAELHRLDTLLDREVTMDTPWEEIADLDLKFHQLLAAFADNPFLAAMHEALISHIHLFLRGFVKSKTNPSAVLAAHLPLLEAIRAGDQEEARRQARLHITCSRQDYERFIAQNITTHGKRREYYD